MKSSESSVVVCFLGDASVTEGEIAEAFQMAVLKLATLVQKFGDHRVFNTPIQEAFIVGSTVGHVCGRFKTYCRNSICRLHLARVKPIIY
jgi:pyruvate/2-oxoglutarate/acetoin dehydrogenase E1 component